MNSLVTGSRAKSHEIFAGDKEGIVGGKGINAAGESCGNDACGAEKNVYFRCSAKDADGSWRRYLGNVGKIERDAFNMSFSFDFETAGEMSDVGNVEMLGKRRRGQRAN